MRRDGILHDELSRAVSEMGHGDVMIVCDAGFPVPRDAWRIDLAVSRDVPTLAQVLEAVAGDMWVERVYYAHAIPEANRPLYEDLVRIFPDAELTPGSPEFIREELALKAKAIVRTGAYNPWGNIALVGGTDMYAWFREPRDLLPHLDDPEVRAFFERRIDRLASLREQD
jgi:simple sugar transport system permease protein/D-ribose pyranase